MDKPLFDDANYETDDKKSPDEEIAKLMKDHYLEQDEAEEVKELMDETGLDEDDAVELKNVL